MRIAWAVLGLGLSGCAGLGVGDGRPVKGGYPADFSLVVLTEPTKAQARSDNAQRWVYILEPDRTLRVASGEGVGTNIFPPRTAVLKPRQMAHAWHLAHTAANATPPPIEDDEPTYTLTLSEHGHRPRTSVPTGQLTASMRRLNQYLVALRQGQAP